MDHQDQQTMDGSPAVVCKSLSDLARTGTYRGHGFTGMDARVIAVQFQCGPIGEVGVNGCAIEDVIDVLIERLAGFQRGPFACTENNNAIEGLAHAKAGLLERTERRQAQGVEGTNAPHAS